MKKKIYLAVTVLLLTLAGIYVAARMILWGGPVSFRSYVLLLGDLLCLLLLVPKNMNSRSVFNVGNFDKIMRMQANLTDLRAVDIKRLFAREISF